MACNCEVALSTFLLKIFLWFFFSVKKNGRRDSGRNHKHSTARLTFKERKNEKLNEIETCST